MSFTVTGSFSASLKLTHKYMAPASNIADTENPWGLIGKYKRPFCILATLNFNYLIFPTYLIPTGYISILALSPDSRLYCLVSPLFNMLGLPVRSLLNIIELTWYIWIVFRYVSNLPTVVTGWSSLLPSILHVIQLPLWWQLWEGSEWLWHLQTIFL